MVIRVSTGGFNNIPATKTTELFNGVGIWDIELSAGAFEIDYQKKILNLISKGNNFSFHNYYPRPRNDFVLNLGSQKKEILFNSREHCKGAIKLASDLGIEYYSIHAGFCIDPNPDSLGKNIGGFKVNSFSKVRDTFTASPPHSLAIIILTLEVSPGLN